VGRPSPVSFRLVTDEPQPQVAVPDPNADPTPPRAPRQAGPIRYKGEVLEAERGPGLGCFRFQVIVLATLIVLTPLSVAWNWPPMVSAALLFAVIFLLLVTGQTIIFLLRLVAADRRGRRRPLASGTKTVGELEDAAVPGAEPAAGPGAEAAVDEISAKSPPGDN
jgi:hypothetical protein